jgi:hypothetical protein
VSSVPSTSEPRSAGKTTGGSEETLKHVLEFEGELNELKALYEQYFLGFERHAPLKKHEALKKKLKVLKGKFVRQTALRFRIESAAQKLLTYERLWERSVKDIEAGTSRRDLFKARLHARQRTVTAKDAEPTFDIEEHLDLSDLDEAHGEAATRPVAAAPPVADVAPLEAPPPAVPSAPRPSAPAPRSTSATGAVTGTRPALQAVDSGTSGVAPRIGPVALTPASGAARSSVELRTETATYPAIPAVRSGPSQALPRGGTSPEGTAATLPAIPAVGAGIAASVPRVGPVALTPPGGRPASGLGSSRESTATQPAMPAVGGGLSDAQIKNIYDAYLTAKRRCGEDTSSLTLVSVAATLRKQLPALMKANRASSVEFRVVIKDGKAVLRAVPKD